MKPLFIPLIKKYFEDFAAGKKKIELRRYGKRWNEKTCTVGREVVLSCGYGKKNRLRGRICKFRKQCGTAFSPGYQNDIRQVYGSVEIDIACLSIADIEPLSA
ncbi:MAG: hypothetical protein VR65_06165 [Desulfobulbaceae bacterium BRH_c16a]|nr:MAG: hypothetical protein VR65_06165 [Desulfobulbaceae bacterium BRH_c16a]